MKKLALTLGAALVALTGISMTTSTAEAGVYVHRGWVRPYARVYPVVPYRAVAPRVYVAPAANCYWTKRRVYTPTSWYWRKVRVCTPY